MKGLKDFRRSLNKDRTSGGRPGASAPPTFTGVKNAVSIQPPKKVIRATRDYRSRAPQELSFHKGDFFHVLSDEAGNPDWLEATNPITNARGLVPAAYFDVLTNNRPPGAGGGGGSVLSSPTLGAPPAGSMGARSGATSPAVTAKGGGGMYAIVKYDFAAERADELEAKAGESIIVIAQSNFEWFVAKPIGRLGGPGLIPVAFVEIKDLTTGRVVENVQELIESGAVPKVEEWKKMTADYKKNTIPLGRFDFQGAAPVNDSPYGQPAPDPPSKDSGYGQTQHSDQLLYQQQQEHQQMMAQQQQMQQQQQQQGQPELPPGMPPGEPLPAGIVTSATVDSFHYEQGDYWFRIQAAHVAGPSSSAPTSVPRAPAGEERDLILYRLYEDFYEFQIALLDHFPAEAGREVDANGQPSERILPLMPGPLDTVDDVITSQRRYDLDAYIVELCALPQYILRSELVRLFFEPRPGDHCTTHPLSQQAQAAAAAAARQKVDANQLGQEYDYLSSHVADEARPPVPPSNGTSKYAEDQPVGPRSSVDDMARSVGRLSMGAGRSSGGGQRNSGQSGTDSRSSGAARSAGGGAASHLQPHGSMSRKHSGTTVDSQGSGTSAHAQQAPPAPQAGAPPFIKIKIFHRANDDLVAIRVPPNVTHAALLEKVRERLGSDLAILRYREQAPEPGASGLMRLSDDEDLREWLASGAKLVLYADVR